MKLASPRSPLVALLSLALIGLLPRAAEAQFSGKAGAITVNLTIPEGVTKMRGVLAFTATGLGSGMASGADFKALAKRLNAGIITIKGANEFGDASYPSRCAKGEFKWLLDAIAAAAKASNHPEITHAPIVGGGHSHGGDYWNYFNTCYPERMALIFCKASGGVQYAKGALKTPAIWQTGMNDLKNSGGNFRASSMSHRALGTQMALVLGPGESHGGFTPGSRQMVIDLIEAYFNLRVPAEVDTSAGPITLYDIDESSGKYWLGDNYSKEIAAYADFPAKADLQKTSFLPNEEVAKKWKAYGAQLPAAITIDKGRCTSCYKPLPDEAEAKPNNAAPPSMGGGGALGAGGSGSTDAGSSSMGSGGTSGSTPMPDPEPAKDAAPAPPAMSPAQPSPPAGTGGSTGASSGSGGAAATPVGEEEPAKVGFGCALGGGRTGSLGLVVVALTWLLGRRRRGQPSL